MPSGGKIFAAFCLTGLLARLLTVLATTGITINLSLILKIEVNAIGVLVAFILLSFISTIRIRIISYAALLGVLLALGLADGVRALTYPRLAVIMAMIGASIPFIPLLRMLIRCDRDTLLKRDPWLDSRRSIQISLLFGALFTTNLFALRLLYQWLRLSQNGYTTGVLIFLPLWVLGLFLDYRTTRAFYEVNVEYFEKKEINRLFILFYRRLGFDSGFALFISTVELLFYTLPTLLLLYLHGYSSATLWAITSMILFSTGHLIAAANNIIIYSIRCKTWRSGSRSYGHLNQDSSCRL